MEIKENSAILIDSPEMSKKIQKRLFELNFRWLINGKNIRDTDTDMLIITTDDRYIYTCFKSYIDDHKSEYKIITPLDLGILPDKWWINRDVNNYKIINDYFNAMGKIGRCLCSVGPINNIGTHDCTGYTELTTEQFKTLVLKESIVEESTKEYYYRFKTEAEFRKDDLWRYGCPKLWTSKMLHLLGKIIDSKYYVHCKSAERFYYRDQQNNICWSIDPADYVKEYNMPDNIQYYNFVALQPVKLSESNLQTNNTNNNGIKISRLSPTIYRGEEKRGNTVYCRKTKTTVIGGYLSY